MKCPYCASLSNRVVDSRLSKEGDEIRRRRVCDDCNRRFTTYERVAEALPLVVKQDGRREPFDRDKIMIGLRKACEKRPVSMDILEKAVERIESWAQEREIPASAVGERVMEELQGLDEVAYVRFASVYRQFKDINQFMKELKGLLERRERKDVHRDR